MNVRSLMIVATVVALGGCARERKPDGPNAWWPKSERREHDPGDYWISATVTLFAPSSFAPPSQTFVTPSFLAERFKGGPGRMLLEWNGWIPESLKLRVEPHPMAYGNGWTHVLNEESVALTFSRGEDDTLRLEVRPENSGAHVVSETFSIKERFVAIEFSGRVRELTSSRMFSACRYLLLLQRG